MDRLTSVGRRVEFFDKKNTLLADFYNEKIRVQRQCPKKLLPHTVGRKKFLLQEIPVWLTQLKAGFHMIAAIAGNNVRQS